MSEDRLPAVGSQPFILIPGLLDEAARYSRWVEEHIGILDAPPLSQMEALRRAVRDGAA